MAKFWEFFENLDEFVYVSDMDTNDLLYMNKRMRDGYGLTPEKYEGRKCYEVLQNRTTPCEDCNSSTLQSGRFEEWSRYDEALDKTLSVKDGIIKENDKRYRVEFAKFIDSPIEAEDRETQLLLLLKEEEKARVSAIADLAIMTERANRSQEFLDMVNDIIGSGLWYMNFDQNGEMTEVVWSKKFREMLGFKDENDFPNTLEAWSDRLHPEDKAATLAAYWETVAGEHEYDVKYRMMKKDGEYDWFHAHGHILNYEDGTPRLFLGIFINITKDIQTKKALEEAYQSAKRANAAKTRFMASMSHDIRTPLNAIIGMNAIAAANINDPKRVERCLNEITASSKHLLSLVNDVLDMNRIESGKVNLNIEAIDLSDLINSFLVMSKPLTTGKHQNFEVVVRDIKHEKVFGDAERIKQCLMNLLSNAVKFTPEGGNITVTISEKTTNRPHRGCFEFVFKDNGIGMDESFIEKVFDPFARADDERAAQQTGTGLGLAITNTIVQMMNGEIKVESKLNEGSTFTATIFLELQETDEAELEKELHGLPILVVDDDQDACESVCFILDELGMKSEWVLTGEEALERAILHHEQQDDYYAVLIDWKMPGMDGVTTTKAIRDAIGLDVPIMIISAYDWNDIEDEAREAGANAFITKPIFKSRVISALQHLNTHEEESETSNALSEFQNADFSGKRALLVEDNQLNALIAIDIMEMTGLTIDHVWNGQEAVDRMNEVEDGAYDVIFMDIQMPIMDGHEATRVIRASDREYLKTIPIIAISANAFAEDVQKSKESGMNEHLEKPLDFDRLLTTLHCYFA